MEAIRQNEKAIQLYVSLLIAEMSDKLVWKKSVGVLGKDNKDSYLMFWLKNLMFLIQKLQKSTVFEI